MSIFETRGRGVGGGTKRRRVQESGQEIAAPEEYLTHIVLFDGQDIYDTAPVRPSGVLPWGYRYGYGYGYGARKALRRATVELPERRTNGKLMADTLGETFACLTCHTMATPIAKPNRNSNELFIH